MKLLFSVLGLGLGMSVHAAESIDMVGAVSGGGGKGVVCRDASGAVKSVELLDLWEERETDGSPLIQSTGDIGKDVENELARLEGVQLATVVNQDGTITLDPQFTLEMLRQEASVFLTTNSKVIRRHGITLTPTDDSFEVIRPKDCAVEQLVVYQQDRVFVDQDLVDQLDGLNQAALIGHEALYSFLRQMSHERDSIRVRRAIGASFAGTTFHTNFPQMPSEDWRCMSGSATGPYYDIHFFPIGEPARGLQTIGVFPNMIDSAEMMGMGQVLVKFQIPSDFADLVLSGKCDGTPGSVMFEPLDLSGPIEFDRKINLAWNCTGRGSADLIISNQPPGRSETSEAHLTCKLSPNPYKTSLH